MFTIRRRTCLSLAAVGSAAALVLFAPLSTANAAPHHIDRLDIAMDFNTFSFEGAVNENGVPAKGTPFVVQGYIYPEGTFARFGELSGVRPDGDPEFPELVLGTWTCRGWHLLDGDVTTGAVVATTQIFDLDPSAPGSHTIISNGVELADSGVRFSRAITGGTGIFSGARGTHKQWFVGGGLNATGGFNATFAFRNLPGLGD